MRPVHLTVTEAQLLLPTMSLLDHRWRPTLPRWCPHGPKSRRDPSGDLVGRRFGCRCGCQFHLAAAWFLLTAGSDLDERHGLLVQGLLTGRMPMRRMRPSRWLESCLAPAATLPSNADRSPVVPCSHKAERYQPGARTRLWEVVLLFSPSSG